MINSRHRRTSRQLLSPHPTPIRRHNRLLREWRWLIRIKNSKTWNRINNNRQPICSRCKCSNSLAWMGKCLLSKWRAWMASNKWLRTRCRDTRSSK